MVAVLLAISMASFELKESTVRGDYYVLRDQPKLSVNTGACDEFLTELEERLGVTVPRFTYLRLKTAGEVSQYGGAYADGLAFMASDTVMSITGCSKHEMVHLATARLGRADGLFEEGLAVMLDGKPDLFGVDRWVNRQKMRDLRYRYATAEKRIRSDDTDLTEKNDLYALADNWVRYLVDKHGMKALCLFFRAQGVTKDARKAFHIVYGGELDAAFDYWLYGKKGFPKPKEARHH